MKTIIVMSFALLLTSCQTYDNTVRKYGGGIKGAITGVKDAIFCGTVGATICGISAGVEGYIDGKVEAREDIKADTNEKTIKALADVQAKEQGAGVGCSWYQFWCD